ncbi:MAG: cbb3-type cytochrome c oxidase subunit I [Candidatus Scalinduaceae bacterium]
MDPVSKNFIRMSVIYFAIAAVIGTQFMFTDHYLFIKNNSIQLLHAHTHLMLLGWMSMMIYGVGYHILPRFNGNPVAFPKLAVVHFWVANVALIGLVSTWGLDRYEFSKIPEQVFAVLNAIGIFMFVINILVSIKKPKEEA